MKMTKEEEKLFNSKTPVEYIDNSLRSKLPPGRKAYVTRLWLAKRKYTVDDIKYARNRHPFWKKLKMKGSYERNLQRRAEHDYTSYGTVEWDEKTILEFIRMNKKDKSGHYVHKDHELAKYFSATIPSIQHYRRKYNMAVALLTRKKSTVTDKRVYEYLVQSEQILRRMMKKRK